MAENEVEVTNLEEEVKSMRVTLADLCARGATLYARKNYDEATDFFSRASNLQAEVLGETAPENAEILFLYGRSLFKVGQSKSDVLGGPAAAEKKTKAKAKANGSASTSKAAEAGAEVTAQQKVASVTEKSKEADGQGQDLTEEKKLLFQFTGDENFDDSEDDEEQADEDEGGEEEEEEEDDLATAFEILDLARVCFVKQLDQIQQEGDKGKDKGKEVETEDSPAVRHIKERLAETHDCLAEISLENERYPNAIEDGRTSLNYKLELYSENSDIIAEAHYKLSLAFEFASVTVSDNDGKNAKREEMDQDLRNEAVKHMELAIKSFRLKMKAAEAEIADAESAGNNEVSQNALTEMKEIIADMEQRLVDLRKDPISAEDLLGGPANPLGGLLGATMGESAAEVEARVEEAKKAAVDLTSLVRKKAKDTDTNQKSAGTPPAATNGKRKAEDDDAAAQDSDSKKAKVEDAPDSEDQ